MAFNTYSLKLKLKFAMGNMQEIVRFCQLEVINMLWYKLKMDSHSTCTLVDIYPEIIWQKANKIRRLV